ncbi:MAG: hypothetical protein ACM3US_08150 [Sphingomonadaceae bacterium]
MDVISGIVVSTSVFLLSSVLVLLFTRVSPGSAPAASGKPTAGGLTQRVMTISLVVYFVAVIDLLLIAQQTSLALGTFVVGLVLLVVYYLEPGLRGRRSEESGGPEGWEG